MGQSFGGYNTVALITRSSIFKAAVATSAAPTDLFQGYTCFEGGLPASLLAQSLPRPGYRCQDERACLSQNQQWLFEICISIPVQVECALSRGVQC
jgi:hypothetical protein